MQVSKSALLPMAVAVVAACTLTVILGICPFGEETGGQPGRVLVKTSGGPADLEQSPIWPIPAATTHDLLGACNTLEQIANPTLRQSWTQGRISLTTAQECERALLLASMDELRVAPREAWKALSEADIVVICDWHPFSPCRHGLAEYVRHRLSKHGSGRTAIALEAISQIDDAEVEGELSRLS